MEQSYSNGDLNFVGFVEATRIRGAREAEVSLNSLPHPQAPLSTANVREGVTLTNHALREIKRRGAAHRDQLLCQFGTL